MSLHRLPPLLLALALAAPCACAEEERVGLYAGPGADAADLEAIETAIPRVGVTVRRVLREGLREALEELDVLVVGSGSGTKLARGLGVDGARAVTDFVRRGGGYVGVGAGAYLAARGYNAHTHVLELVDARIVDPRGWRRGSGTVELEAIGAARLPARRWVYQNGPLFAPARSHGAVPYVAWARFASDIAAGDPRRAGVMPGTDAVVRAAFGRGRAVLFSVLPHRDPATATALFDAVCWAAGDGPAPIPPPLPKPGPDAVRVAVLDDEGCIDGCVEGSFRALGTPAGRFFVRRVSGAQVRTGALADYDLVLLPGGSATGQHRALGRTGLEALRRFVAQGGGYVGICAGAYLAAVEPTRYGQGLAAVRVVDTRHWKRGEGTVELEGLPGLAEVAGRRPGKLRMLYANGPLLEAVPAPELPPVRPLARFLSDLHRDGAPAGVMPGKLALLSTTYQEGRVVLFSTHPELTPGCGSLLVHAVLWATRRAQAEAPPASAGTAR